MEVLVYWSMMARTFVTASVTAAIRAVKLGVAFWAFTATVTASFRTEMAWFTAKTALLYWVVTVWRDEAGMKGWAIPHAICASLRTSWTPVSKAWT